MNNIRVSVFRGTRWKVAMGGGGGEGEKRGALLKKKF